MKQLLVVLIGIVMVSGVFAAADAEEATHGNEAARLIIEDSWKFDGGQVTQFNLAVLAQYSYVIESNGEALIVDPVRTVDEYFRFLNEKKLTLKGVFLTHSHADFIAGHMEIARKANVPVYISELAKAGYPHKPLTEKSVVSVGSLTLRFLTTPGHTPEGMVGQVFSKSDKTPTLLFTGDTLFVGSVGRPDLMGGTLSASWLAGKLYDTLNSKIKTMNDSVRFYPAHGAGSLCGANLSDASWSTIGDQKKNNPFLKIKGKNEFISAVIADLPEAPPYFGHNAHLNTVGPPLVDWEKKVPTVEPSERFLDASTYSVVDIRSSEEYSEAHLKGSLNIALRGRIETWVGIMIPWGSRLYLVGSVEEVTEAVKRLHNVGYEVAGRIDIDQWKKKSLSVAVNRKVSPESLYRDFQNHSSPVVVDVRLPKEWKAVAIGNILNYPLNHLKELSQKLEKSDPVVAVCNSAYRSSMAIGVLEREGFENVASLDGGRELWEEKGLPQVYGDTEHKAQPLQSFVLPSRMSPEELNRILLDIPESVQIVDVRPQSRFNDYHIPGSVNESISSLLNDPKWLSGEVPLVLVCRDGSISMAIGGVLSQNSQRSIHVLYGGVQAWWKSVRSLGSGKGKSVGAGPSGDTSGAPCPLRTVPAQSFESNQSVQPVQPAPVKTKRRSAGC